MTTTLLVLLVGEMLSPFEADFRQALPLAFPDGVPELAVGTSAPPGRSVAWVTVQPDGLQVEVLLHTARIAGDLRRVLRFTPGDPPRDRARATAFTLAAMVRERDADLQSLEPPPPVAPPGVITPPPAPPGPAETPWVLDVSALVGLDLPGASFGGGGGVHLRRALFSRLSVGVGAEVAAFSTPRTLLVQPSLFAELGVPLISQRFSLTVLAGGGVSAPVLSRADLAQTTWLPLLRAVLEGRWALGPHQGLRFALTGHFVPVSLSIRVGSEPVGTVGPAWIRPEIGYFAEL